MIAILLATYNGERFLKAQVESILRQTEQRFTLYIRDDRSTDGTFAIAEDYAARYPDRVHAAQNAANSGGAKENFLRMMADHQDDYVMLCDQDDVWLDTKIERTLSAMRALEEAHGRDRPLLVHTDLRVVGETLDEMHASYWAYAHVDPSRNRLNQLCMQNNAAGCTILYNRPLAALLSKDVPYCVMHDYWAMLVAAAFGHIGALPEATILYRQHGENSVGVKPTRSALYKLRHLLRGAALRANLAERYQQAEGFLAAYRDLLSPAQVSLLTDFSRIPRHAKLGRLRETARLDAWKAGAAKRIGQLLYM